MSTLNILLLILVSILSGIYFYFMHKFNYWQRKGVPHDPPSFPLGNMSGVGTRFPLFTFTQNIYNKYKGKEKFAGMYFLAKTSVIVWMSIS